MARLSRMAYRIVWANPRSASERYEPLVAGMTAALPYIDTMVSGHSPAALERLLLAIHRTDSDRPRRGSAVTAATRWTEALAAWAIPEPILAAAPESPWGFPPSLFASAAIESVSGSLTPSHVRALDALPDRGFVLDVGSGAGAASLPLAPPAGRIVAVDMSAAMLTELRQLVAGRALVDTVEGRWPDVAAQVPVADVAVSRACRLQRRRSG